MPRKPKRTMSGMVILPDSLLHEADKMSEGAMPLIPPVDLYESADCYVLSAELPGVEREDIHVEVRGSEIAIWGERKVDMCCSDESYHRLEGIRGRFHRTFSLPEAIEDDTEIKATLQDGVLSVELPKSGKSRPIAIQGSRAGR